MVWELASSAASVVTLFGDRETLQPDVTARKQAIPTKNELIQLLEMDDIFN